MKRVLWKMPSILAVFGLALVTAGCPTEPETQTNGPAVMAFELVAITVTGIPADHQNQSVDLTLRHLTSGGWASRSGGQQVEGTSATFSLAAFPGTYGVELRFSNWPRSYYFIPSRNITAGTQTIPFSDFTPVEEVSITVTGIPERYISSGWNWIEGIMSIICPRTFARQGSYSGVQTRTISGASVTFTTRVVPGSYDIRLRFSGVNIIYYSASSINITAGINTIPFSYFDIVEPITVTLTGIPSRYIGDEVIIALNTPGLFDGISFGFGRFIESSAVFTFFTLPGTYAVAMLIEYETEDGWRSSVYSAPSRNITAGTNTIPFSAFTMVPSMSITVTGIPSEYRRDKAIFLAFPNTNAGVAEGRIYPVTDASATIDSFLRFDGWVFNTAGTYDVHLGFWTDNGVEIYFIPSRHLNAGSNTIPFSEFTPVAPDASGSIHGFTENVIPEGPHAGSHERLPARPPVGRFR